jgi:hypothetical protein
MKISINKDITPLLISIVIVVVSIIITLFTNYTLNYKHYVGILLIGISLFFYFQNRKLFIYLFLLTLILGIINVIDIYYSNIIFRIGPIKFNPIFLFLLVVFLISNKEILNELFQKKEILEQNLSQEKVVDEKMVKIYERKFLSKSESELMKIAAEKSGYVNEARIASKNILKHKIT